MSTPIEAAVAKPNCGTTVAEVTGDYTSWFNSLFHASPGNKNWFDETRKHLVASFNGDDCLKKLPAAGPIEPMVASIKDIDPLQQVLKKFAKQTTQWCSDMADVARCLQYNHLECEEALALYMHSKSALDALNGHLPKFGAMNAQQTCAEMTRWARQFGLFATLFARWENVLYACLHPTTPQPGSPQSRQLTSPPWPPWKTFDGDEPDGSGT